MSYSMCFFINLTYLEQIKFIFVEDYVVMLFVIIAVEVWTFLLLTVQVYFGDDEALCDYVILV